MIAVVRDDTKPIMYIIDNKQQLQFVSTETGSTLSTVRINLPTSYFPMAVSQNSTHVVVMGWLNNGTTNMVYLAAVSKADQSQSITYVTLPDGLGGNCVYLTGNPCIYVRGISLQPGSFWVHAAYTQTYVYKIGFDGSILSSQLLPNCQINVCLFNSFTPDPSSPNSVLFTYAPSDSSSPNNLMVFRTGDGASLLSGTIQFTHTTNSYGSGVIGLTAFGSDVLTGDLVASIHRPSTNELTIAAFKLSASSGSTCSSSPPATVTSTAISYSTFRAVIVTSISKF